MKSFLVPIKLTVAQLRAHPVRLLLTAIAMIASASSVVWVVSGYDGLIAKFDDMADDFLGRYQLVIVPKSSLVAALPADLIRELSDDRGVAEAVAFSQSDISLRVASGEAVRGAEQTRAANASERGGRGSGRRGNAQRGGMRMQNPSLIGLASEAPPYPLVQGSWLEAGSDSQAVVSKNVAAQFGVMPGSKIEVTHALDGRGQSAPNASPQTLTVVGVIDQPQTQSALAPRGDAAKGAARGPAAAAVYVLPPTAEKALNGPAEANMLCIRLKDSTPLSTFRERWEKRLAIAEPAALVVTQQEVETGLTESFSTRSLRGQAYSATGMALLASLLVIYTALSIGVTERGRQLAMLRAVALTRVQVAGMVLFEAVLLAALGWGGGLLAGWLLLTLNSPSGAESGVATLGWQCVLLSGIGALGGALMAAVLPVWRAMRQSPLSGMQRRTSLPAVTSIARRLSLVGVALITIPLPLAFAIDFSDDLTYAVCTALGVLSLAMGVLLLSPMAVIVADRWLSPLFARLMGLDGRLLKGQLSSNLWRTIGAAASLTIGLSLYVATQTWGQSMLQPFVPGRWMPDVLVHFPKGVSDADVPEVISSEAAQEGRVLPIALEQPGLTDDVTNSEERWNAARADSVVLCGVDAEKAFGGSRPMLDLEFTDGTMAEALPEIKAGRGCLVADFLQAESGLRVGDKLRLSPPSSPDHPVEFTIVGVVKQPGVHWLTKMSGMRRRGGLMAGVVFATYEEVRRDFAQTSNDFYWVDLRPGKTAMDLQQSLEPIAERNGNPSQPPRMMGRFNSGPAVKEADFRTAVTTANDVDRFVSGRADEVIWSMSQLPLVTLFIGTLGVVNAMMASVLSRQWEFGVLRAVGVSRDALFRIVIVEALLIAIVACALSLVFGVISGYCGTGLARYAYRHGGILVPLVLPWTQLMFGFAFAVVLCIAAALAPAAITAWKEPLRLLRLGREAG